MIEWKWNPYYEEEKRPIESLLQDVKAEIEINRMCKAFRESLK